MTLALLSGPFHHHLDHLAPLAYFFKIPLFVDDPEVYALGKLYYPDVEIVLKRIDLQEIGSRFSLLLLSTQGAAFEMRALLRLLGFTHMRFCYCPHGHSDKGCKNPEVTRLLDQDLVLLYGPLQYERLQKQKELPPYLSVGNYRALYYELHRESLDKTVALFPQKQKSLLYAPTWDDTEYGTSFFTYYEALLENLPENLNLLIKLHPFLEKYHPAHAYRALSFDQTRPNLRVLLTSPPLYPLLNQMDLYLGDYSAIGYDFLYFNRPMFSFGKEKTRLHGCGRHLTTVAELYQNLDDRQEDLMEERRLLYQEAFSKVDFLHFWARSFVICCSILCYAY